MPEVPERPPITLLSPTDGLIRGGVSYMAQPLTRVVIASDDAAPTTVQEWNDLGDREAWPQLMQSVRRRGLVPQASWAMIIDPGPDWRRHIHTSIQDQVDATMRDNPQVRVLCVAILVDTASLRSPDGR